MACKDIGRAPKEVKTVVASGKDKSPGSSATFSEKNPTTSNANDSGVTPSHEPVRSKNDVRAMKERFALSSNLMKVWRLLFVMVLVKQIIFICTLEKLL